MWCYEHGAETQCHCLRWDTHTDADLAMALELAQLLADDYDNMALDSSDYWDIAKWLRTEVRNALLERAQ